MKDWHIATVLAALVATGCASMGKPGTTLGNVAVRAQQITVQVCGFEPTIGTVEDILATGNPALQAADSIADAICEAVNALPKAGLMPPVMPAVYLMVDGTPVPKPKPKPKATVNGVPVHGRFVK